MSHPLKSHQLSHYNYTFYENNFIFRRLKQKVEAQKVVGDGKFKLNPTLKSLLSVKINSWMSTIYIWCWCHRGSISIQQKSLSYRNLCSYHWWHNVVSMCMHVYLSILLVFHASKSWVAPTLCYSRWSTFYSYYYCLTVKSHTN